MDCVRESALRLRLPRRLRLHVGEQSWLRRFMQRRNADTAHPPLATSEGMLDIQQKRMPPI
jgi:hypothetical protein